MSKLYTVGVRRRWFPFFRRFKVVKHHTEVAGPDVRFVLYRVDGTVLSLPRLDRLVIRVYPDFWNKPPESQDG